MGAFHSTKNSGFKFRKFLVSNGTVHPENLHQPRWTKPFHSVSDGNFQKKKIRQRGTGNPNFSNGTVISDQN